MRTIYLYSYILFISLSVTSCDYISNPFPPSNTNLGDTSSCPTPTFPTITTHIKKTLVEDYTGHTCTNCPKAAQQLYEADTTYKEKVIGLAIHVGSFAEPAPSSSTPSSAPSWAYLNDYRTSAGNEYDNVFKMAAGGLPKLMVNRSPYNGTTFTHRKEWYQLQTAVAAVVNNAPQAEIQIINEFNTSTKKLCSHIKTEFLNAQTGTYKLVVLMVQDSIIDWQFDTGVNDSDYVHKHVLRDAITTSAWGDEIATNPSAGATSVKKYAYNIPNDYNGTATNMHHMYVVAYIYNTTTYEVIQAEEEKVMD